MKKENKGFTLIETVLSIALMGVVIVTVLGVFVKGSQALKKGRYRLIGVNIAQRKNDSGRVSPFQISQLQ